MKSNITPLEKFPRCDLYFKCFKCSIVPTHSLYHEKGLINGNYSNVIGGIYGVFFQEERKLKLVIPESPPKGKLFVDTLVLQSL